MVDGEFITMEITAMDINQTELHDVNYAGRVIISIYFILVAIFGFFGNLIILVVLVKIPKMRSHTNIFIGSLAVSDLTTCLMLPFIAAGILSKTGWPMPNWMCIINAIVRFTSQGSSVWNLVAIAVNRLVLVTMSARLYRVLYQTSTIIVNIAFVWLFPLSCVIIPYLTGDIVIGFDKGPNICSDTDFDSDGNPAHTFVYIQGLVLSCIPLVIVVVCYIRIYVYVRLHIRRQNKTATSMMSMVARRPTRPEPSSMTSSELKTESETNDGKTAKKSQIKRHLPPTLASYFVLDSFGFDKVVHWWTQKQVEKISFRRNYSQLESASPRTVSTCSWDSSSASYPYGICILADIGFDGAPLAMIFSSPVPV
nr:melatonin receptor type 1A-like [Lytechinus pictus]